MLEKLVNFELTSTKKSLPKEISSLESIYCNHCENEIKGHAVYDSQGHPYCCDSCKDKHHKDLGIYELLLFSNSKLSPFIISKRDLDSSKPYHY